MQMQFYKDMPVPVFVHGSEYNEIKFMVCVRRGCTNAD